MDKRREELEKKRAKLAELRRAREERQRPSSASSSSGGGGNAGTTSPSASSSNANAAAAVADAGRRDVDALVQSLVGTSPTVVQSTAAAKEPTAVADSGNDDSGPGQGQRRGRQTQLQVSDVATLCDIQPQQPIRYDKVVQTAAVRIGDGGAASSCDDDADAADSSLVDARRLKAEQAELERLRQKLAAEESERAAAAADQELKRQRQQHERALAAAKQSLLAAGDDLTLLPGNDTGDTVSTSLSITDDAGQPRLRRVDLMKSEQFVAFVDRSSKLIERAIDEPYDVLTDYTRDMAADRRGDSLSAAKLSAVFFDTRLTQSRRSVTALSWSQKFPELVLGAYSCMDNEFGSSVAAGSMGDLSDYEGVINVWNLHLLARSEFTFYSRSKITAAQFSAFHPNLIVGGTYAGQVLLWDTRAKSIPVLSSPLSATGHKHPIYSIAMVGTQQAHNIVTASTDGMVCTWQFDMLSRPLETLELVHTTHPRTEEVSVTSLAFPGNESAAFWVGTLEGNVYQANRYDRAGNKAGIQTNDTYAGHAGVITGLHFHPINGAYDFSELLLTSSIDWTVKLWKIQPLSKPSVTPTTIKPLLSFENANDYVNDVAWSPVHPALFASVDATGTLDIWNLNRDTEAPAESVQVTNDGSALNKVAWDKSGSKCAVAGCNGQIYVYDVGEMGTPAMDDFTQFQRSVQQMHASSLRRDGVATVGH